MPHFMIVLTPYINLLNLSCVCVGGGGGGGGGGRVVRRCRVWHPADIGLQLDKACYPCSR